MLLHTEYRSLAKVTNWSQLGFCSVCCETMLHTEQNGECHGTICTFSLRCLSVRNLSALAMFLRSKRGVFFPVAWDKMVMVSGMIIALGVVVPSM